ncbi:glycerol transporter [Varicellaria rhodocarpa]|nr:glycerol transporter [Varicellaria rhodocarpa]
MNILNYARNMYSLDTLDTRFTTSSRNPMSSGASHIESTKLSFRERSSGRTNRDGTEKNKQLPEALPSRWGTLEYYLYYLVIGTAVPLMFKAAYDISLRCTASHPNYTKYEHLLSAGWIPGHKVDNSDDQYSNFRDNVPYMFVLLVTHPILRRIYEFVTCTRKNPSVPLADSKSLYPPQASTADVRLSQRVNFDVYFSLLFVIALHGISALKVVLILYSNYYLAIKLPKEYIPSYTWVFNLAILFANELCRGYPFAAFASFVSPPGLQESSGPKNWGSLLDSYGGLIPRWEIFFKITILRLISFNMDFYWSAGRGGASPLEKKQLDSMDLSDRDRVDIPAKHQDFCFRNYLAYVLYSPLYLAGPIITFNDYISQLRYPPKSVSSSRTLLYGIRFAICLLTMEVMQHFIYAVAISKASPTWEVYTPFQLSMLGYFNLHHIWLKLLLPWRFFRLWSLIDGIDAPENVVRCMSDNYSTLAFWRGWHRSFNRWSIRYIYIPLGGSGSPGNQSMLGKSRAIVNALAVFTFVAIWHDINLRLLLWGWLITLFILPEVIAGFIFPKKRWGNSPNAYRLICGLGAVGNILMMIAANLVGFAVGIEGLQGLLEGILGTYSGK